MGDEESKPKITILIPAYNEENRIGETLENFVNFFHDVEIIVEMDGCTDKTLEIVKSYSGKKINNNIIRYLHFNNRLGKGMGLLKASQSAKGDILAFTDADCSTSPLEMLKLISGLDGNDCAIGSRWLSGSIIVKKQPLKRRIASRGFNQIVRLLFNIPFKDTQCGAKVIKKNAFGIIINDMSTYNYAFDIDLIYQLLKKGFKIKEIPIVWVDKDGSSINLFKTSLAMFLAVIRLRVINSDLNIMMRSRITNFIYSSMRKWL